MCTRRVGCGVLAVLALACTLARSDDTRKPQPEDPDPGFLEFLGSVDRLAEVNPDYLAQADPQRAARLAAKGRAPPAAPPPPPPSASGVKNNE
ncbi:MAG TPA: hypothetical protein VN835_05905 [Steroidobacteraceae bacterium]|nr:hypothetical protein [Steroidobacteraceae bacterium]